MTAAHVHALRERDHILQLGSQLTFMAICRLSYVIAIFYVFCQFPAKTSQPNP